VRDWYAANVMPELKRLLGKEPVLDDYLPVGNAATYLQYHYIVANPHPADQRSLLDDPVTAAATAPSMPSTIRCCGPRQIQPASGT